MIKVGITGGIGSGKSTVCRLFAARGVAVYDSDAAAKRLMAGPLREAVEARFGQESYRDGVLDRRYLADIVFRDREALQALDAIVHPAVMRDFEAWASEQQGDYVVLESAILFDSGFYRRIHLDFVVCVTAPVPVRIQRIMQRDHIPAEKAQQWIDAVMPQEELAARSDFEIVNDGEQDIEAQVRKLLDIINNKE